MPIHAHVELSPSRITPAAPLHLLVIATSSGQLSAFRRADPRKGVPYCFAAPWRTQTGRVERVWCWRSPIHGLAVRGLVVGQPFRNRTTSLTYWDWSGR